MRVPELTSPAGDLSKLRSVYLYGADAAYCGWEDFSLRRQAVNFSYADLKTAAAMADRLGRKLSLAFNIFFRDSDFGGAAEVLSRVKECGVRTLILSDPGMARAVRRRFPSFEIHVSTQANTTNSEAVKAWQDAGAKRVILARELSLKEIALVRKKCPRVELEAFVHGAMCVAVSGRCLLSLELSGRDANRGDCRQPCRWEYALTERRDGTKHLAVETGKEWSAVLSSKDLNMSRHIGRMIDAGIDSLKIEGRMKSEYYAAVTTRVYRHSIDAAVRGRRPSPAVLRELDEVSHRPYGTGFYFGRPRDGGTVRTGKGQYVRTREFFAVIGARRIDGLNGLDVRNPFGQDSAVEVVPANPGWKPYRLKDYGLYARRDGKIVKVDSVKIQDRAYIRTCTAEAEGTILRSGG